MQNELNNVILFPRWKSSLQEESLKALQEKNYSTALDNFNKLLSYNVTTHEIIFGKLICLIELEAYEEAQEVCEEQLEKKCENYYDYVHLYLTILFQAGKYQLLMSQVDYELSNKMLPSVLREQFQQLYKLSKQMNNEVIVQEAAENAKYLKEVVEEKDNVNKQYRIVKHLHNQNANPTNEIIQMLAEDNIHPVLKTTIFMWLQDKELNKEISISKFNVQKDFNPVKILPLTEHNIYKLGISLIQEDEHKDPSMTKLLEQLFYRYIFVAFPIMPTTEATHNIVEAIKVIGKQNLHNEDVSQIRPELTECINEVNLYETLYLTIIEE